jgi:hypothetical protein
MSAAELEALVDPLRLKRINSSWIFDVKRSRSAAAAKAARKTKAESPLRNERARS